MRKRDDTQKVKATKQARGATAKASFDKVAGGKTATEVIIPNSTVDPEAATDWKSAKTARDVTSLGKKAGVAGKGRRKAASRIKKLRGFRKKAK